jgi:hypothetical protein
MHVQTWNQSKVASPLEAACRVKRSFWGVEGTPLNCDWTGMQLMGTNCVWLEWYLCRLVITDSRLPTSCCCHWHMVSWVGHAPHKHWPRRVLLLNELLLYLWRSDLSCFSELRDWQKPACLFFMLEWSWVTIASHTMPFRYLDISDKYSAIINDVCDNKLVYFRNGYKYKHEMTWRQHGNSLSFRCQHWL